MVNTSDVSILKFPLRPVALKRDDKWVLRMLIQDLRTPCTL
jgi:hypothetical protein